VEKQTMFFKSKCDLEIRIDQINKLSDTSVLEKEIKMLKKSLNDSVSQSFSNKTKINELEKKINE
jgi:hypothetical protein